MHQDLECALDRAEYIVESARQRPAKKRGPSSGKKSLYHKLYDLYTEECEKEPELKKLRRNVHLLEKLASQESVSCLVVNLYPGNEGYSLMLRGKNGCDSETIRLPYEEGELLEYLDAEELPPVLVDLLEKSQVNIFHCGCVIAEIRDYRQSGNTKMPMYQNRHILLRPTMQTLICDVHAMTTDNHKWTQDDKLQLESQLILATADPLCLEPSVSVTCTANRLLYNKQKMNTRSMKRCFKRHSRAALNRQQELARSAPPPQLRLFDYLQKRRERKPALSIDLKISKAGNCVDMWRQSSCQLSTPAQVDVEKYAVAERSIKLEDSQPTVWPAHEVKDDYLFESEVDSEVRNTRVTIFQAVGNPLVYGKIYSAKEPQPEKEEEEEEGSDHHLIHTPFLIGSKIDANRFLNQYREVYERDLRCPVKMSHNLGAAGKQSPAQTEMETDTGLLSSPAQPSALGKGLKHRPALVKLPAGSGSYSSGNAHGSPSSGHLKSTTPPPSKPLSLSRKHSAELGQVGLLSSTALLHVGPSQRSGSPKPSTPTPKNTPCSTPLSPDIQTSTPTPLDPTVLTPFTQPPVALSQALPVMPILRPTTATSITTSSSTSQVMTNASGLNFINVVGSICSPQALLTGSNPMLGCGSGAITSGMNLSGILPPAGLMSGALPTMRSASPTGSPFGLNNAPVLRPLSLLQIPTGPVIFNSLPQQLSQFSPQQPGNNSATSSPQQQGEPASDHGVGGPDQGLANQQTAVINLTGVGSFMSPQAAALSQLGCALDSSRSGLPAPGLQLSPALQQQHQQQIQLRFLQHQMQQQMVMGVAAAGAQAASPRQPSASQPRSKRKRSTPHAFSKS
ncbi:hypothetical protein AAFF_G00089540 [Aldrovandia affinis]|uniref:Spt20-like SEP domain-containing protein n=1 Tax=Aldrovandia affinis TaxID=143900 RepID=A0AAD7RWE7_9TELE|nr:hypothetical protein AAFF_G00089540 [Aldrovandia affinis]